MNNGHTKPRIKTPAFAQSPPKMAQPLVAAAPPATKVAEKLAAIKQAQDLQIERVAGMVAIVNSAIPVINATIGDPNHNMQTLARIVTERNCDIAEDFVEIVISEDE